MTTKHLYGWPRGLSEAEAATYVGVGVSKFRDEVAAGIWPKPNRRGRRIIWDRHLLDLAYDRISDISSFDLDLEWGLKG